MSRRRVAHLEPQNVVGLQSEAHVGLCIDLVRAAEAVEVVDVERAEIHLHRVEKIVERDALRLRLVAVDVRAHLRRVDLESREDSGKARRCPRDLDDRCVS